LVDGIKREYTHCESECVLETESKTLLLGLWQFVSLFRCDFELEILSIFVPGRSSGEDGKQQSMAGKGKKRSVGVVSVQLEEK